MKKLLELLDIKKILIILTPISSLLLVISFLIYSSTFNTVAQRIDGSDNPLSSADSLLQDDEDFWTTTESVFEDVYNSSASGSILPVLTNPFSTEPEKVVYLTIDDGPDPKSTPQYLEVLRQYNVKATFFMVGATMERNPHLVKDIDSEGHAIGNHSYTHNYGSLYANTENFTEEILKTEEIIYSLTGKKNKIFRAPGGSPNMRKTELLDNLNELGYAYFDWNVSAADTAPRGITKSQVIYNIKRESKGVKKVIVLMHDNHRRMASVEALPEVIEWFKEKGYEFGTLNESVEPIHIKWKAQKSKTSKTVTEAVYQSGN